MKNTKTFTSRWGKEYELQVCEPAPGQIKGDASDISIVRANALEELLLSLGGAVKTEVLEIEDKGLIFKISDDTGFTCFGTGDWSSKSLTDKIAQAYPLATAYSRAMSAAVVKYFGFEGRVYSDAAFTVVEDDETETTTASVSEETSATPEKKPAKKATEPADENPVATEGAPSEWIWTGKTCKGMTLSAIAEIDDPKRFPSAPREGCTRGLSYLLYMYENGGAGRPQSGGSPEQMAALKEFLGGLVE